MIEWTNERSSLEDIAMVLAAERDPEALTASREIDEMIREARLSYGVGTDPEAARRFLADLGHDPAARIRDPGPPVVQRRDPPGLLRAGVEDGTKNFNWEAPPSSDIGLPNPYLSTTEAQTGPPASSPGLEEWLQSSSPTWMPSPRVPG